MSQQDAIQKSADDYERMVPDSIMPDSQETAGTIRNSQGIVGTVRNEEAAREAVEQLHDVEVLPGVDAFVGSRQTCNSTSANVKKAKATAEKIAAAKPEDVAILIIRDLKKEAAEMRAELRAIRSVTIQSDEEEVSYTTVRDPTGIKPDLEDGQKYLRRIVDQEGNAANVDVYDVLHAFGVTDQAIGHAVKKLLCAGQRGKANRRDDLRGAVAAIQRAITMFDQDVSHG